MSSYRMTPEISDKMQEIIESIAKLPCARPFLTPVNPDDDSSHTYYKKIKDPMDLSLIKMRLLLKKYQYVSDLQTDMNLILKNSRSFNGPSHFITQLAEILIKNFEKMLYAIFPMTVRMWIEKVNDLTRKIQNLFVNTKMPNYIETESIISATIKQSLEQQDPIIKQALMSRKFGKLSIFKNPKTSNNSLSNSGANKFKSFDSNTKNDMEDQSIFFNFTNDMEDHYTKPLANNSFVIPVIQPQPTSILKSSNLNIQSEDDFIKPSFIPSPVEPVFIPYPTIKMNNSIFGSKNNDEVTDFYMNHFYDYGFSNEFIEIDNPQEKSNSRDNKRYSYREEEEEVSDDIFVQLDVLNLDNFHFNDSDDDISQDYNSLSTCNLNYEGATQLLDQYDESNDQEQSAIQKSRQTKEKDVKDRKPTLRKTQENDEFKMKEAKPRGRPKKIKLPTDDKEMILEKDKEKSTDKIKNKDKSKDKDKDKAKDKVKTKAKTKDKADEKSIKTSKRIPKDPKEKKEIKELKEPKGRKFPKKVSHIRKTKSDSDFNENKASQNKTSEDHIERDHNQNNEKISTSKRKTQTKRQNRKNLSADEADDDDFLPPSKPSSQISSSSNSKKRKNKNGKGRYKKFAYDDDYDYQYGGNNDDEWGSNTGNDNAIEEPLTDGHLIAFMEAAHQLNGPNDQKEMAAIIHSTEPQISFSGAYPVIDITKLKTVTLLALIKYTKKKFKERGKEYPIL